MPDRRRRHGMDQDGNPSLRTGFRVRRGWSRIPAALPSRVPLIETDRSHAVFRSQRTSQDTRLSGSARCRITCIVASRTNARRFLGGGLSYRPVMAGSEERNALHEHVHSSTAVSGQLNGIPGGYTQRPGTSAGPLCDFPVQLPRFSSHRSGVQPEHGDFAGPSLDMVRTHRR